MWGKRSPWRKWPAERIVERHEILDRLLHADFVVRDIHRLYLLLDGKSAALFSHVSIMIAACTFRLAVHLTMIVLTKKQDF